MSKTKSTHGGARPGSGPKRKPETLVTFSVRLTPARKEKVKRLGREWLFDVIDQAPDY